MKYYVNMSFHYFKNIARVKFYPIYIKSSDSQYGFAINWIDWCFLWMIPIFVSYVKKRDKKERGMKKSERIPYF